MLYEVITRARRQPRVGDRPSQRCTPRSLGRSGRRHERFARLLQLLHKSAGFFLFFPNGIEKARIDDDGADLESDRRQSACFLRGKQPGFLGLDDNNPERAFPVKKRDSKKGVIPFFASFFEVSIAGMGLGFLDGDRMATLGCHAGEPLADLQSNPTNRLARQIV